VSSTVILPDQTVAIVAVAAAGVAGLLLPVTIFLLVRLARLRRAYASALDPSRREDLFQAVQRQAGDLRTLREDVGVVHANTEHLRELIRGTVSRVGMVRYDAFPDMGGALSFSAALLDERGDGVVISAINGRSETRCYAKPVAAGDSAHNLSEEESAAIRAAVEGGGATVSEGTAKRGRWRAS
jgi:hypothetical protein